MTIALSTLLLASVPALAVDCKSLDGQIGDALKKVRAKESGGFKNSSATPDADVTAAEQMIKQAQNQGCNLGPQFKPRMESGQGTLIDSQYTPSAPGETKIVEDPTYNKQFRLPLLDPTRLLPINANEEFKTPEFETPYRDEVNNKKKGECGKVASDFGANLKSQTGQNRPAYKEGCPGATGCAANEYGKFGLIDAAYNNEMQSVNVNSLLAKGPGNVTAAETVAFKDVNTGSNNEVNGCRLSNYASCGQAGDIILVQSNPSSGTTDNFDTYLIYDGKGGFYEITNSSQVLKSGALNPAYNSMSYAAMRMACAVPATTTTTP